MKLLKLQATFGKLHDTLELSGGIDYITAPNEAGKSTWTAFLVAMFYGIDTSKHATKTSIPIKTKYKPWSGAAMQGTVELEWNGRHITIERRSTARAPMSEFRAYETQTGLPVTELTADNCGEILFGAKREVFERSALLQQTNLQLSKDAELDRRLASLVTTGDETASYGVAEKKLRDLRNAIYRNPTGQLPQCKAKLAEVENSLLSLRQVQKNCIDLAAAQKQLQAKADEEEAQLSQIGKAEQVRRARQLAQEQAFVQQQEQTVTELKKLTQELPEPSALHRLDLCCREAENELKTAQLEKASVPPAPQEPKMLFAGKDDAQLRAQAEEDKKTLEALSAPVNTGGRLLASGCLVLSVLAAAAGILVHPAIFAACAVFAAGGVFFLLRHRQQTSLYRDNQSRRESLLRQYGAQEPTAIVQIIDEQIALRKAYVQAAEEHTQLFKQAEEKTQQAQKRQQELLAEVQQFAPQIQQFSDVSAALHAAEKAHDAYLAEERSLQQAKRQLSNLQELVGTVEEQGELPQNLPDAQTVRASYNQTVRQLQTVTDQLNLSRGRISAMGDAVVLEAEKEQLLERIAVLEKTGAAATLAAEKLLAANDSLQARFSPQIAQLAGRYFGQLTGGSYDRLYLDREMNVQVTQKDDPLQRPVQALSCGTADQLYFAVRLAMAELLLKEDCPLILDDALLNFDDERAERALQILREQSKNRQIIAFSCHGREAEYLKQINDN